VHHGILKVLADLRKSRKSTAKPAKDAEKCLFFSVISAISPGGTLPAGHRDGAGRCAVKMSFPENRPDFENTLASALPADRIWPILVKGFMIRRI
jgi:hypothetical protein